MEMSTRQTHAATLSFSDNNNSKSEEKGRHSASPKIYTKTGDLGYTSLLGCGGFVPKWHKKIRAYGSVDELNSHLSQVREVIRMMPEFIETVSDIQQILFVASSWLSRADYKAANVRPTLNELSYEFVKELEDGIDKMTARLPPLKNFILLTGVGTSAIHIARSVCRRTESEVADAIYSADALEYDQYSLIMIYLNRLSDWLFTVARYHLHLTSQDEILVKPPAAQKPVINLTCAITIADVNKVHNVIDYRTDCS